MQAQYRGFCTLLSSKAPNQVHVLCYVHVLNLVLAETTEMAISSLSFFSLMNDTAVFICESYQRMNLWEQRSQDTQHRRLSTTGETRWWANDVALKRIFGSFRKPHHALDQALYIDATLYAYLALLDLRHFTEVSSGTLPNSAFYELNNCLLRVDSRAADVKLKSELKCLAAQWPRLKMSSLEEYKVGMEGGGCDDDEEDTYVLNKQSTNLVRNAQSVAIKF